MTTKTTTKTEATVAYYEMTDGRPHRWVNIDILARRVGVSAEELAKAFRSDDQIEIRGGLQAEFLHKG